MNKKTDKSHYYTELAQVKFTKQQLELVEEALKVYNKRNIEGITFTHFIRTQVIWSCLKILQMVEGNNA